MADPDVLADHVRLTELAQAAAASDTTLDLAQLHLLPVLPKEINLTRQFWMYCREDLRKLKRITLLWDYIREVTELNRPLLMGETRDLLFTD